MKTMATAVAVVLGISGLAAGKSTHWRGKTDGDYQARYWTWAVGGESPNHHGNVTMMPIPAPAVWDDQGVGHGEMEVELQANQSFFLPCFVYYGETYNNGLPPDPVDWPAREMFLASTVLVTVDGVPILDSRTEGDLARHYSDPVYFKKPLVYPEPTGYGSDAAIWVKGLGVLQGPLAAGDHTVELWVTNEFLLGWGFFGWHNVWQVHVSK